MTRLAQWFTDLVATIREIAKAVAHTRSHPNEPPKHGDE